MKRIFGGVLMLAGAFCLYLFTTRAMYQGRALLNGPFDLNLPFTLLGADYPTDALLMLGALWGFLLGFYFVLMGYERGAYTVGSRGGGIARIMLLNGLLLVSSLSVAFIGAKSNRDSALVVIFGLVAAAQIALGAILLILAIFERPKGVLSLLLGAAVWIFGVGVGVLAFLWGA